MKTPLYSDESFLDYVNFQELTHPDKLKVFWLGQSGYLISRGTTRFLIDPYLSDTLTHKYACTTKPHVRVAKRVIDPAVLKRISFVTSSHNHTDHLDAETIHAVAHANPSLPLILPAANYEFARERLLGTTQFGFDSAEIPLHLIGCDIHQPIVIADVTITAVPAAHERLETNARGQHHFHGYIFTIGPHRIYHSGDCMPYDTLVNHVKRYEPTIALLPINGADPSRGVAGNFSGEQAASIAKALGVEVVLPNHYDMFAFNTADTRPFIIACGAISQPFQILQLGEALLR